MTLALLNFVVLQWLGVRLAAVRDVETGDITDWYWVGPVLPLSGWSSHYVFLGAPTPAGRLGAATALLGLYAVLTALTGCHPMPGPVDPPRAVEACEAFCDLQARLACGPVDSPGVDGVDGTADDITCRTVCEDLVAEGRYTPDRPCLDQAQTCEAAEACVFGKAEASRLTPGGGSQGAPSAPRWLAHALPPPPPVRAPERRLYRVRGKKRRRAPGEA